MINLLMDFLSFNQKRKVLSIVKPYTMLTYPRLSKLYDIAGSLERKNINGSFVECGVFNGGSAGVIASASKHNNRDIWLFDSWEGLPEPSEYDISYLGEHGRRGSLLGSIEKVEELLFEKIKISRHKIHIAKGWFNESIPRHKRDIGEIALLHLDCDWYESTKFCLQELYDRVVKNGFIFIDDYGHWKGCKKAFDEFNKERSLKIKPNNIDYTGIYFKKN